MQITLEIPDAVAEQIGAADPQFARDLLQAFAFDAYRAGKLSGWQVRQMLGIETRWDLDRLLKEAGIYREYTAEELEQDYQNARWTRERIEKSQA